MRIVLWLFSGISVLNAVWMLGAPQNWYHNLPAHVPEYGPLNTHFVRDIGIAFLIAGIGLAAATRNPIHRRSFVMFASLFYAGHALVHLFEAFTGGAAAHLWKGELAMVYFPALILSGISIFLYRSQSG